MSECIKYCGQCSKTDLPNVRDKEPIHIGYPYAYKTDCEGNAYIKVEEVRSIIEQAREDIITEIEKTMHDAYKGTSNNWECMVFDLVLEQIKEQENERIHKLC